VAAGQTLAHPCNGHLPCTLKGQCHPPEHVLQDERQLGHQP